MKKDILKIAGKSLQSRLIVGTGKYKSFSETAKAIKASGADMVTVAIRRVNILDKKKPILTDYLNPKKIIYLPNTAGCFNSDEALRTLRLAREMGGWKLVKLEVLGDKKTLYPDMIETIKSTKILVKEGFKVMVYCTDDPILAKKLEDNGASAIMPLASPIGSGLGLQNKVNISLIIKQSKVPVIVDAGIGTASDATIAMELGCDGVLINSAIANAKKPVLMAKAFKDAVVSGRNSFMAGRMQKNYFALPSSQTKGLIYSFFFLLTQRVLGFFFTFFFLISFLSFFNSFFFSFGFLVIIFFDFFISEIIFIFSIVFTSFFDLFSNSILYSGIINF